MAAMNLEEARKQLARISRLFDDIADNGDQASSLEVDLIKDYTRKFYESLSSAKPSDIALSATEKVTEPLPTVSSEKVSSGHRPALKRSVRAEAIASPSVPEKPNIQGIAVEKEMPIEAPAAEQKLTSKLTAPKVISIPPSVEAEVRAVESQISGQTAKLPITNEKVPAQSTADLSPKMKELFTIEKAGDISDRLAESPIKDLTRSMAINERLLTQNQLFGGDKAALDEALQTLNGLGSYEEATSYLAQGAAIANNWLDEENRPTARAFARLVRRKYIQS